MTEENDSDNEEQINIMTIGNSAVGKTCFILRFTENIFEDIYLSTIGIDFKIKKIKIKDKKYKIFFYDTTGQERYVSIAFNTIKNADGIFLMYDITNEQSFQSLPEWINSVREAKGNDFPIILLGNKIDKEEERKITKEAGKELADKYEFGFFEISNKEGINIEKAGLALIKKILDKKKDDDPDYTISNTIRLNNTKISEKAGIHKKCC